MIFYATRLTMAVHNCRTSLEKIAKCLTPESDPRHDELASEFMDAAVTQYNHEKLNAMIEDAMKKYLNHSLLLSGMDDYCERFGLKADLSEMSNDERVLYIAAHKDEIEHQLMAAGK